MIELGHELQAHYNELVVGMSMLVFAMAFPKAIRHEVYKRQKGNCAECNEHFPKLETHHRVPHSLGGPDTIDNAVGLCGPVPQGGNGCHQEADRLAFQGIIYPQKHNE